MTKRILIVDDTQFMRTMLSDILVQNGFAVAGEAGNGKEAIRLYDELRPDAVVMDINMPEMGGIEAIREVLKLDPGAVILVCTAASQQGQIHEAMREGAKGYILKPFKMSKVIEIINKYAGVSDEQQMTETPADRNEGTTDDGDTAVATMEAEANTSEMSSGITGLSHADAVEKVQLEINNVPAVQMNTVVASQEENSARDEAAASKERIGSVGPRRDSMNSFVSSVMCRWQEEKEGETASFTVVCTESENKVMVEMTGAGGDKQTIPFSLEGLLQLGRWLNDHVERTVAARNAG